MPEEAKGEAKQEGEPFDWLKHRDTFVVEDLRTLSLHLRRGVWDDEGELKTTDRAFASFVGEVNEHGLYSTKRLHQGKETNTRCEVCAYCHEMEGDEDLVGHAKYEPDFEGTDDGVAETKAGHFVVYLFLDRQQFDFLVGNVRAGKLPGVFSVEVDDERIEIERNWVTNTANWPDGLVKVTAATFGFPVQQDPEHLDPDLDDSDLNGQVLELHQQKLLELVQRSSNHLRVLVGFSWFFAVVLVAWLVDSWWD